MVIVEYEVQMIDSINTFSTFHYKLFINCLQRYVSFPHNHESFPAWTFCCPSQVRDAIVSRNEDG
jgi:hypothetical protein